MQQNFESSLGAMVGSVELKKFNLNKETASSTFSGEAYLGKGCWKSMAPRKGAPNLTRVSKKIDNVKVEG